MTNYLQGMLNKKLVINHYALVINQRLLYFALNFR